MNKTICGVVVDEKKYREVYAKSYFISGVNCAFDYVELGVAVLNGTESAKGFTTDPAFCENCRRIYERTRSELISYNKAKGLNEQGNEISNMTEGDLEIMKHENFGGYVGDLKNIFGKACLQREALMKALADAKAEWDEARKSNDEYEQTRTKLAYMDAEKNYKREVVELERSTKSEIKAVRGEFIAHLEDFYTPNGKNLDADTVALLNSGISLKGKEIDRIVEKHLKNPTMLRIINDYCVKNGIKDHETRGLVSLATADGKHEQRAFDDAVSIIEAVYGTDDVKAITRIDGKSRFMEMLDRTTESLNNYVLSPRAQETAPSEEE